MPCIYISYNKSKKIILVLFSIGLIFTCLSGYSFADKDKAKVLFIGLDGATWNIMRPLAAEGRLPNIKRLMDTGSFGNLESYNPLVSEIIWTSIATGKSPDKHNIKDSLAKDPETQELVPVTSNLRNAKAIWNILSEYKKKVGIISYMCTWPPENINRIMVSDRINPANYSAKGYTFPPLETLCSEQEFKNFSHIENSIFSHIYDMPDFLIQKPRSEKHDKTGIIIISGKDIKRHHKIAGSAIYDITPTILYFMGLPIGKDMNGKILINAIENSHLRAHPLEYIDSYEENKTENPKKPIRSPEDEEKIKQLMRSLGYTN